MLRIIEGGFFSRAHEEIKNEILKLVRDGKRVFLIVPEQQALVSEAEMTELLPTSSPLFFEVTNFTRLSNTVFRGLGGADASYCDNTKKSLIMWRVLTELSATLTMTGGRHEVSSGIVERALAAVAQMDSLGIGTEELNAALNSVPKSEGRLLSKLEDLIAIMTLYKKTLSERYADTSDDVTVATRLIKENPTFFDGASFFVEGFTSFTKGQYALLGLLARLENVTVHLTLPRAERDAFLYTEIRETQERLSQAANKEGADKKIDRLADEVKNELLYEACNGLWHTTGKIDKDCLQNTDALRIFECESPYDECDFIAADIKRRVMAGAKYRDFAVIARRAEDYLGIIDSSLEAAGVPHFISKRRDAATFEAIKLIFTAFSVISGGYRREDVIAYAKCSPFGISREACDEFELYCELWQINGSRFSDGEIWNMSPEGYTTRHTDAEREKLLSINETRTRLITPLRRFEEELSRAKTVDDFSKCLINFLVEIKLEEETERKSQRLIELGEGTLAEDNARLWEIICSSLDTLHDTLGDAPATTDGFVAQLKVVFASVDIGKIPSFYDSVTVGSADMLRLNEKRHVYLIGVNRGEFPAAVNDNSYFTDRDKTTLSDINPDFKPEVETRAARELFAFSRAFAYGEESVTLLYSTRGAALNDQKRADVIDRIGAMTEEFNPVTNEPEPKIKPVSLKTLGEAELISSPETALYHLGNLDTPPYLSVKDALLSTDYSGLVGVAEGKIQNDRLTLSKQTRNAIYKDELYLTQSRIDAFNNCPLLYYCRYNLSLTPSERAEFDSRNVGSFVHAILEGFFKRVNSENIDLNTLDDRTREKMVREEADAYLCALDDGGTVRTKREELMLNRLICAAMPVVKNVCDEFCASDFKPRYFELEIKDGSDRHPEPLRFTTGGGGSVVIKGIIDRVDTLNSDGEVFVRVVDYKTGAKEFKPSDIDEKKNLQMFLYLKAIVESKNEKFLKELGATDGNPPVAAGVTYTKSELGDVRINTPSASDAALEIDKAQTRRGMMLDDEAVKAGTSAKHSTVKFKINGEPHDYCADNLYTREDWQRTSEKLERLVGEIADDMTSGNIAATPLVEKKHSPCSYCEFKPFCRSQKL